MARPKSDNPRTQKLLVRVTVEEKAEVEAAAKRAGTSTSEFVRDRVLGSTPPPAPSPVGSPSPPPQPPRRDRRGAAKPRVDPVRAASIVAKALPPVEAEAEEAFVARRTKQLHGAGNTTPVARRLARAEWRDR